MRGVFVLSLDCEGLWGRADQLQVLERRDINTRSLSDAYDFIARTLAANQLRSTCAFVSAFACDRDLLLSLLPDLERLDELRPGWLTHVLPRLGHQHAGALDGFEGHRFARQLSAEGHEIGWHGATHVPLDATTSAAAMDQELNISGRIARSLGRIATSVVFPRNLVGHLPRLRKEGFRNFRAAPARGQLARVSGIAAEWNVLASADHDMPHVQDDWCVIPAGHFLNWPSGPRAAVPVQVTVQRWTSMLRDAAQRGGIVHMWFHPHNLITAPAMRESFSRILQIAGTLVRSGDLENLTMADLQERCGV